DEGVQLDDVGQQPAAVAPRRNKVSEAWQPPASGDERAQVRRAVRRRGAEGVHGGGPSGGGEGGQDRRGRGSDGEGVGDHLLARKSEGRQVGSPWKRLQSSWNSRRSCEILAGLMRNRRAAAFVCSPSISVSATSRRRPPCAANHSGKSMRNAA